MRSLYEKIVAFILSVLAFFGLFRPSAAEPPAAEPDVQIITHHHMSVDVSSKGVIERAYCTDENCTESVEVGITLPMKHTLRGSFDCSDENYRMIDNSTVFVYNTTDFDGYMDEMKNLGCELVRTYSLGNNRYALMKHPYFTVYVSLLCAEGQLRVNIGRSDELAPPQMTGAASGETAPKLWQLSIDNEAAKQNGGMGYILQLSDGSYIIVDGGYETDADAEAIFDVLTQNNPSDCEKPVIAAWFITHQHSDHYGAFYRFTRNYKDAVEVKAFYCNLPYRDFDDIHPQNCKNLEGVMASWPGAVLYRKLHSGMRFRICNADVAVICTFEDIYPFDLSDGNDTSLVFQVSLGGQRILFTGDAEYGESDRMKYLDASVLQSDFLQYPHHGFDKQCKEDFYEKVNPAVVLWPMPFVNHITSGTVFDWRYETRAENAWVKNAECVKKIVVNDEGLTCFDLPYTPEGERICDYASLTGT